MCKVARGNKEYQKALAFFDVSLTIYTENKAVKGVGTTLSNMGETYMDLKDYDKAGECIQQSLDIATELGFPLDIQIAAEMLTQISKEKGDFKKAFEMHELYMLMRDSLTNIENNRLAIKQKFQYEYNMKSVADSVLTAEEKKVTDAQITTQKAQIEQEQIKRYTLYGGLAIVLLFGGFMYNRFRVSKKQNTIINEQKEINIEINFSLPLRLEELAGNFIICRGPEVLALDTRDNIDTWLGAQDDLITLPDNIKFETMDPERRYQWVVLPFFLDP